MNTVSRLRPIAFFISFLALLALACNAPLREGITVTIEPPTVETKIEITSEPEPTTDVVKELVGTRVIFETETPSATETSTATPTVTITSTADPTVAAAILTVTVEAEQTATAAAATSTPRPTNTTAPTNTPASTSTPWPTKTIAWVPTNTPWPSPSPTSIPTTVWVPTNTPRPAATATKTATAVPQSQPLAFDYTVWWRKSETEGGIAIATFTINARGGDGNYQYFHDDLPVEGPTFEVRWGTCRAKPGSLRIDSAGQSVRIDYFEQSAC